MTIEDKEIFRRLKKTDISIHLLNNSIRRVFILRETKGKVILCLCLGVPKSEETTAGV